MKNKGKIRKICVISPGYPTDKYPMFPFVDQLLCAFTLHGVECTVISPQSLTKAVTNRAYTRPTYWSREYRSTKIDVYQPRYFSLSNFRIHGNMLSDILFESSVIKAFKTLHKKNRFDAIYGHFWNCGLIAAKLGYEYGLPSYVACGESEINIEEFSRNIKYAKFLNGVICVSSKCLNECIEKKLCNKEKAVVIPNAIDNELFHLKKKAEIRKELGFPLSEFIVAFVGSFIDRKGSKRLSEALESIPNAYSIFIGSGSEAPTCNNRLFTGAVPHDKVPDYLNAADVFVLPTLNEGCCNAIIEAMACGLPIISSDLSFNWDVLNKENSILINPNDVEAIRSAIIYLMGNPETREQFSRNALNTANKLTISERARYIIEFMESKDES